MADRISLAPATLTLCLTDDEFTVLNRAPSPYLPAFEAECDIFAQALEFISNRYTDLQHHWFAVHRRLLNQRCVTALMEFPSSYPLVLRRDDAGLVAEFTGRFAEALTDLGSLPLYYGDEFAKYASKLRAHARGIREAAGVLVTAEVPLGWEGEPPRVHIRTIPEFVAYLREERYREHGWQKAFDRSETTWCNRILHNIEAWLIWKQIDARPGPMPLDLVCAVDERIAWLSNRAPTRDVDTHAASVAGSRCSAAHTSSEQRKGGRAPPDQETLAVRTIVSERWEYFKVNYKELGHRRASWETFALWASDEFDDMPTDKPERLKAIYGAHRKSKPTEECKNG